MSKKSRRLSEDDLEVWRRVAASATPLTDAPRRVLPEAGDPPEPAPRRANGTSPDPVRGTVPSFRIGETGRYDHSKGHDLAPTLATRLAGQPVRMDRKAFRRLRKGKLRPERTLDLHGMTLAQAHPALTRFILAAAADEVRLVVVVTGKGKSRDDDGPIPTPRGVLRHQVPGWLQAPPLGALVLQVAEAHASHGGSGAYYVYLARRR